ncbi:MAG: hypothetical protein KC994_02245 [Candidatus Omnitrophica bacterium]|nr:hypothetical protein [Candidatus Omnitrophota bacterium]
MESDNRVQETLIQGMRDLQNLLVHIQTVLQEIGIPVLRSGGGLTFCGFSFQVDKDAPVDWIGHHIDRPEILIYQIQDRVLPKDCPLSNLKRLQARQYERTMELNEDSFFFKSDRDQMDAIGEFLSETVEYLRGLPPEDEDAPTEPFIPVIDRNR